MDEIQKRIDEWIRVADYLREYTTVEAVTLAGVQLLLEAESERRKPDMAKPCGLGGCVRNPGHAALGLKCAY